MKNIAFNILIKIVIIIAMILSGYLLLVLVYAMPTERMEKHVQESCYILEGEGVYPELEGLTISKLDNFTDALMLLKASFPNSEDNWKAAVRVEGYSVENKDPFQTLLAVYKYGAEDVGSGAYSRYWHGYLLFLKPLLILFHYGQIRYIIMFMQLLLFSLLIERLARQKKELVFPTVCMWFFVNPIATMNSLQYNNVLTLTFIAMLIVVCFADHWRRDVGRWGIFFLAVGGLTSYFDLLTYPLVTLGVPLILWISLSGCGEIGESIKNIVTMSANWVIGYGGLWGGKWILGSIITGDNIIQNAVGAIRTRTSSLLLPGNKITYLDVLLEQFPLSERYAWGGAGLLACLLVYKIFRQKKDKVKNFLPYMIVGAYPFAWYYILKNHSFIHSFFTYREFTIALYAILVYIVSCGTLPKVEGKLNYTADRQDLQ